MSTVNEDYGKAGVGIGQHRGPGERWDGPPSEHAPVAPFNPFGEPIAEQALGLQEAIDRLGAVIAAATPPDGPTAPPPDAPIILTAAERALVEAQAAASRPQSPISR